MITVPIVVAWFGYYALGTRMQMTWKRSFAIIGLFIVVYFVLGKAYDAFLVSYNRIFEMFLGQMVAILVADTIMFIVLWIVNWVFPNLVPAILALLAQLTLSMLWCVIAHSWYFLLRQRSFEGSRPGALLSFMTRGRVWRIYCRNTDLKKNSRFIP